MHICKITQPGNLCFNIIPATAPWWRPQNWTKHVGDNNIRYRHFTSVQLLVHYISSLYSVLIALRERVPQLREHLLPTDRLCGKSAVGLEMPVMDHLLWRMRSDNLRQSEDVARAAKFAPRPTQLPGRGSE